MSMSDPVNSKTVKLCPKTRVFLIENHFTVGVHQLTTLDLHKSPIKVAYQ